MVGPTLLSFSDDQRTAYRNAANSASTLLRWHQPKQQTKGLHANTSTLNTGFMTCVKL